MGGGELPVGEGLGGGGEGAAEQGPGGADTVVGGAGPQAQPGPKPAGGGAGLEVVFGPGRPAGVHPGQLSEPVAFQAVQQLSQLEHPFGPDRVGQPVLRTFLGETQYVAFAFGTTITVVGYWVGQAIGRGLAIWPIGRFLKKW